MPARFLICGLVVLVGCAQPQPTPTTDATAQSSDRPSPAATSALPSPTLIAREGLAFERIDQRFTTPALAYTTDGHALIWSSGAPNEGAQGASNLWRHVPGSPEPELLYALPNQDSNLMALGGNGQDAYAFLEVSERLYQPGGWRLWLLPSPGTQPLVLDEASTEGYLPLFGMDAEHVAWATLHEVGGGRMSELRVADIATGTVTTLMSRPLEEAVLQFPSIDDGRIVVSSTTVGPDNAGYEVDVYLLDLAMPGVERQLNGDQNAFYAAIDGDTVVWQQPSGELNPLNGGPLAVHSLSSGRSRVIEFPSHDGLVIDHSVSGRWVTAQGANGPYTKLYLYDLEEDRAVLIDDLGEEIIDPPLVDMRPVVGGSIIAFVRGSNAPDAHLELMWGELPD